MIKVEYDGFIWPDTVRNPTAILTISKPRRVRKWICSKLGHRFHSLDFLIFKIEYMGWDRLARLKCCRCGESFTLEELREGRR